MNLLFWGLTVSMVGKILLATGVLIAHTELAHEKRVDSIVLKSFKFERVLTLTGIILIIAGYMMEVRFYGFDTTLLTCIGSECINSANLIFSQ